MTIRVIAIFCACLGFLAGQATAQDKSLTLAAPSAMVDSGFMQHLLPRFAFKTRIRISPVEDAAGADLVMAVSAGGEAVFQTADGDPVTLEIRTTDPARTEMATAFFDWLDSDPGMAAVEGFPAGGPPEYSRIGLVEAAVQVVELDGDVAAGSKLALLHCGRCHVVDHRNPMGGIGSTPSFPALRGRTGWSDLFLAFWAENPHPSFTQVEDVTEPFPPERPPHIAPLELTLEDIDAITAYVGTLQVKDLGAGVAPR